MRVFINEADINQLVDDVERYQKRMKWPRGKYNGKRIVGFHVEVKVDVTYWHWWPVIEYQWGPIAIHWLCFYSWWDANFE